MLNCISVDEKKSSRETKNQAAKSPSVNIDYRLSKSYSTTCPLSERHMNGRHFYGDQMHVLRTNQTPEYIFNNEGIITIRGRGLYCDIPVLSDQIISWIEGYTDKPAEITHVTIALEYLNSLSTAVLITILEKLSSVIMHSGKLDIKWFYEDDDEDILDKGEYISTTLDIPIKFISTAKCNY